MTRFLCYIAHYSLIGFFFFFLKQIIQIQHNRIKNPNWHEAISWLFTSVAKNLNLG